MFIPKATLLEMLDYHYSRRERVLDYLAAEVKPEDFVKPMNAGYSNMRSTLVHCLAAEAFWVQYGMQKGERSNFDFSQYPDVSAVRVLAGQVRHRTEQFVAGLSDADLAREATITFSSGAETRFSLAKGFFHIITHDTHHRGQVWVLARQLGYEPPEIDLM